MTHFWEKAFARSQMMWGEEPTRSATLAAERFAERGVKQVLIPGIGYGRNAKPFLAKAMAVTGIEVSATAIALARMASPPSRRSKSRCRMARCFRSSTCSAADSPPRIRGNHHSKVSPAQSSLRYSADR